MEATREQIVQTCLGSKEKLGSSCGRLLFWLTDPDLTRCEYIKGPRTRKDILPSWLYPPSTTRSTEIRSIPRTRLDLSLHPSVKSVIDIYKYIHH